MTCFLALRSFLNSVKDFFSSFSSKSFYKISVHPWIQESTIFLTRTTSRSDLSYLESLLTWRAASPSSSHTSSICFWEDWMLPLISLSFSVCWSIWASRVLRLSIRSLLALRVLIFLIFLSRSLLCLINVGRSVILWKRSVVTESRCCLRTHFGRAKTVWVDVDVEERMLMEPWETLHTSTHQVRMTPRAPSEVWQQMPPFLPSSVADRMSNALFWSRCKWSDKYYMPSEERTEGQWMSFTGFTYWLRA